MTPMRTAIPALIAVLLATFANTRAAEPHQKLAVIATLFPQYDFAKRIAGDNASVRLLLPPGAESHSFEPTPGNMRDISDADLFIYTGEHMEPWAKRLADAADAGGRVRIVDASEKIHLKNIAAEDDHNHAHDNHDGDHDAHFHAFDPHIWLNPALARKMIDTIADALANTAPANAQTYRRNADALKLEIDALDKDFAATVAASPKRLLVFGERFAFGYFFDHYGLEYAGAYKSCAPGAEPGLKAVIETVETVRKNDIRHIYLEDMSTGRIANVIHQETGAEILRVDSLHNPPAERQAAGDGYVDIMRENMAAFAKGLR